MSNLDEINKSNMIKFEKEFFFLCVDIQMLILNLLSNMFAWSAQRQWVKFAKTHWLGSRIQFYLALPVLQILSPSIKLEEIAGVYNTFYAVWDTDDFIVEPDLKKLNEIILIRNKCESIGLNI